MLLKCLLGIVFLFISISNVESTHTCRNRTVPADLDNNRTNALEEMRKIIKAYWSFDNPDFVLSPYAQEFVNAIKDLLDTDSGEFMGTMLTFSVRHAFHTVLIDGNPGLCARAEIVNASVEFSESGDARSIMAAIRSNYNLRYSSCVALTNDALIASGCKKIPLNNITAMGNCHKKGREYEFDKAMDIFGPVLPCPLADLLRPLYYSKSYTNNIIAAAFLSAFVNGGKPWLWNDVSAVVETLRVYIDPIEVKCCCKSRRKRYIKLCQRVASLDLDPFLVGYMTTECPPDAAYEK